MSVAGIGLIFLWHIRSALVAIFTLPIAIKGRNSALTVVGHAEGGITELDPGCKACGDDSAFCCAARPVTAATKVMEKEKKKRRALRPDCTGLV